MANTGNGANLNEIRDYFGYENAGTFRSDWMKLSKSDRDEIKAGFANGSMTY